MLARFTNNIVNKNACVYLGQSDDMFPAHHAQQMAAHIHRVKFFFLKVFHTNYTTLLFQIMLYYKFACVAHNLRHLHPTWRSWGCSCPARLLKKTSLSIRVKHMKQMIKCAALFKEISLCRRLSDWKEASNITPCARIFF